MQRIKLKEIYLRDGARVRLPSGRVPGQTLTAGDSTKGRGGHVDELWLVPGVGYVVRADGHSDLALVPESMVSCAIASDLDSPAAFPPSGYDPDTDNPMLAARAKRGPGRPPKAKA